MVYHPVSVRPSVHTSFPDNSSYSFHRIALKLDGQLDHEMVQRILFRVYSTLNFDKVITLFNDFFLLLILFPENHPAIFIRSD